MPPPKKFGPLLSAMLFLSTAAPIYAQAKLVDTSPGYAPLTELETIFGNVLNVVTLLAGFAVLLMLIIGAFRYMAAQGDPKAIGSARSHITWAFIGLFFIVAAWLVLLFVAQFTGVNLTHFCVQLPGGTTCKLQR